MKTSLLSVRACAGSWRCFIGLLVVIVLGGSDRSLRTRSDVGAAESRPAVAAGTAAGKSDTPPAAPVLLVNPRAGSTGPALTGRVCLRGTPPPEKDLTGLLPPDYRKALAGRPLSTRFFVVGADAGLADVVVHLRAGLAGRKYPPPAEPVVITTAGFQFLPYVTAAQTGQTILIRNQDAVWHDIHSTALQDKRGKAPIFKGPEAKFVFHSPELLLRFKSDLHPWMFGYVNVIEHPFFGMTDTNGVFRIPLPPPGRYELEAVHRRAGKSVQNIVVEPGKELAVEFTLEVTQ